MFPRFQVKNDEMYRRKRKRERESYISYVSFLDFLLTWVPVKGSNAGGIVPPWFVKLDK